MRRWSSSSVVIEQCTQIPTPLKIITIVVTFNIPFASLSLFCGFTASSPSFVVYAIYLNFIFAFAVIVFFMCYAFPAYKKPPTRHLCRTKLRFIDLLHFQLRFFLHPFSSLILSFSHFERFSLIAVLLPPPSSLSPSFFLFNRLLCLGVSCASVHLFLWAWNSVYACCGNMCRRQWYDCH